MIPSQELNCDPATKRYNTFNRKVVTLSSFVTSEHLPPTEYATKFHYHKAYYQIMTWIGEKDGMCCELGWSTEHQLMPLCCK